MKNRKFLWLLRKTQGPRGKPWTVGDIAQAIYCSRARVNDALNNKHKIGGQIRPKLIRFFKENFSGEFDVILNSLGWTYLDGNIKVNPVQVSANCNNLNADSSTWNATEVPSSALDPWYVTGLAEGEGGFTYSREGRLVQPKFSLGLRHDYEDLVVSLVDFFGCGNVYRNKARPPSQASIVYRITNKEDLLKVIDHFQKYALRSLKKRLAFGVWREIVNARISMPKNPDPEVINRLSSLAQELSGLNTRPRNKLFAA